MTDSIVFRPANLATPGEREFLAKSWVESYASSATAKLVTHQGIETAQERYRWKPSPEYWSTWDTIANTLLRRAHVLVAEDPDTHPVGTLPPNDWGKAPANDNALTGLIAGFLVWELDDEGTVVHYVYTRLAYRRSGVARRLVAEIPGGSVRYTHRGWGVRVPAGWRFTLRPLLGLLPEPERRSA